MTSKQPWIRYGAHTFGRRAYRVYIGSRGLDIEAYRLKYKCLDVGVWGLRRSGHLGVLGGSGFGVLGV